MSGRNDDELGAVIYTELLDISEPSCISEICDRVQGLRKSQERVAFLLQTMCDNDMVVNVGGRYIVKEKWKPNIDKDSAHLSCDGPAHLSCDDPAHGITYENGERTVPVQQSVVRRSSSSDSTCDAATLQICTDNLKKIIDMLQQSPGPVKARDIAQRTGIGQAKSDVNRYLYFLKTQNVLQNIDRAEWILNKQVHVKDEDLRVYAAQLARSPPSKSKGKQSSGSGNDVCACPNAGRNCHHVTNNFQQNIHHHHYNIQVGEHNQMASALPPDGAPPERDGH